MTEEVKTMKYDPNDRKFFFNEEKILTSESAVACRKNYDSWQKDTINNLPGVIVDYLKDEDGRLQGSMVLCHNRIFRSCIVCAAYYSCEGF